MIKIVKRSVYSIISHFLRPILFSHSAFQGAATLFKHRRLLVGADRVTIMAEGGFGHAIWGPEAFRRLYKDERLVYLVFERGYDNPSIQLLWKDVSVIPLRLSRSVWILGYEFVWISGGGVRRLIERLLGQILRMVSSADVLSIYELYRRVATLRYGWNWEQELDFREGIEWQTSRQLGYSWEVGFFDLLKKVQVPKARLSSELINEIKNKVRKSIGNTDPEDNPPFASFYIRSKGEGLADKTTSRRVGGQVEDYLPAMEALIKAGYLILLTGDRVPNRDTVDKFSGKIVWADRLGIDRGLFSLFTMTESAIWVGNEGGGVTLPVPMGIPMLVIDSFPYGIGRPNAWMCYKLVRDEHGRLVHYDGLFRNHNYDFELRDGWTVHNNSPEKIAEAVESFLLEMTQDKMTEEQNRVLGTLPDYVMDKQVKVRFSTPWLKIFREDANPIHKDDKDPVDKDKVGLGYEGST